MQEPLLTAAKEPPPVSRLDGYFKYTARGSSLTTEIRAGIVNFLCNSYLLVLIPQILHNEGRGLPKDAYLIAFVVSTSASSILLGLLANLPIPAGVGIAFAGCHCRQLTLSTL